MSIVWLYAVCPVIGYFTYQYSVASYGPLRALLLSIVIAYLPTYPITDHLSKHGGLQSKWVQTFPAFCQHFKNLLNGSVNLEAELDHEKSYIFGSFPHGTCSVNHVLTMTDACGMLTKHHKGDRRDLAASVLFMIPIVKEILLLLGCVDASSATCHYNLKRGRSILVFVGGEKEQLMTEPGSHKIYLLNRKGFVKLALQYGCDLVPMYAFGENEAYDTSHFLAGFRSWLQHKFKLGIPIFFGRHGLPFGLMPKKVSVGVEVGKPIPVRKLEKAQIADKDIDALHAQFVLEMRRLFERTKARHGVDEKTVLQIL